MPLQSLAARHTPSTHLTSHPAAAEAPQQQAAGRPGQRRHTRTAAMRQRGAALLQQAAAGLGRAATAPGGAAIAGARRRLVPPAAGTQHPSSNGSTGAAAAAEFSTRAGSGRDAGRPLTSSAAGSSSGQPTSSGGMDAAIDGAAPASWAPRQRDALRDTVRAKIAAMQAHLEGNGKTLWNLRGQPEQLEALGVSAEELLSLVLKQYGTSQQALDQLAALVASKQVAVLEGGADHWTHLQEQRRLGQAAAPQAPPPAQQPASAPQQQQGSGYVPSWRAAQQAATAAQQQQYQQPPWEQQQQTESLDDALERTTPSSSQVADGSRPGGGAWAPPGRQQWQQGRGQQAAPPPAPPAAPVRASIRDLLNERKIRLPAYAPGTYNHLNCPECLGGDKGEKSLSVTIDEGSEKAVWNCFRAKCGWTGSVNTQAGINKAYRQFTNADGFAVTSMRKRKEESPLRPNPSFDAELSPQVVDFFSARGIGAATLARNRVAQETLADGSIAIAFPYYRDGTLVNIKYRSLAEKKFWQVRGAEKVLFGLDDIVGAADIVVVEGEMDKLALEEAGFRNVVSVPDGAPARVKEGEVPPADQDTKFSYLWNCRAWLDQATRVVIATDNDAPGDALAEELARRLGRERCWRVRWPLNEEDFVYAAEAAGVAFTRPGEEGGEGAAAGVPEEGSELLEGLGPDLPGTEGAADGAAAEVEQGAAGAELATAAAAGSEAMQLRVQAAYYRKDANEVLMRDGAGMLRAFLENAEPFPIRGLLRFHEYYDDIIKYYRLEHKDGQGRSTGWAALDQLYKVVPGELTIVTGVPNSGKSEWIDALLANLAEQHDWCFALCSMEKKATDHARQLVEKYVGKPFFDLPYARGVRRMSERELDEGLDWIDDRFHLVRYEDDALPAVDWVLDVARAAVYRYGIRGLVIDPYNELDHQRPASMNETEYVSQMLTKVKRFAQTTGVHVWFVAHPRQLREWKGQAPNLYDISGSAHFINKADNGIVVHRDRDPDSPDQRKVQILVRKVRNKAAGTIGDCELEYERVNGRYIDPDNPCPPACRTAQRVDFAALARQQQREADAGAAAAAAAEAPVARAPAAVVGGNGPPRPAPGPAAAAAAVREPAVAAVGGAQLHTQAAAQQQQPPQQQQRWQRPSPPPTPPVPLEEEEPPRPLPAPMVTWRSDGTISGDPVTDEQEIAAWLADDI